jgi:hypothetical protein
MQLRLLQTPQTQQPLQMWLLLQTPPLLLQTLPRPLPMLLPQLLQTQRLLQFFL